MPFVLKIPNMYLLSVTAALFGGVQLPGSGSTGDEMSTSSETNGCSEN